MPNRNYEAGRRFEYAMKKRHEELGLTCFRTAGSKGEFDLIAVHPKEGLIVFIQCKVTKRTAEANRMLKAFKTKPPFPNRNLYQCLIVKDMQAREERTTWA